ncbi:MAG: hypothetical protein JRL30_01040 [Deltaproteobacteria bacterium]|nr:hypothetical protein [Deltaproteobacteria bacterium]
MRWRLQDHERCAQTPTPLYDLAEDKENWAARSACSEGERTTIDFLVGCAGIGDHRVLHVGVGNSRLARELAPSVASIKGVTINPKEKDRADLLAIENYKVVVGDKHLWPTYKRFGNNPKYDWIVDSDLTCYACCKWHGVNLFLLYLDMLAPEGTIWTNEKQFASRWGPKNGLRAPTLPKMRLDKLKQFRSDLGVTIARYDNGVVSIRRNG